MNLQDQFIQYWRKQWPDQPVQNYRLILAVSGGIDSVVLAHLLFNAGFSFSIAHCNFQLRGEESNRDEAFVRALGEKYGVPVLVQHFDTNTFATEQKLSVQEAARELRYNWFAQLLEKEALQQTETGAFHRKVLLATAHHANDNIETLLMNFFRGTGIGGLHGILPAQEQIIRPLLFAGRAAIAAYAAEQGLTWVEDSSNASDKYTRNYFRLQLIPDIQKVFPQVEDNLLHNIERFAEIEILYRQSVEQHLKKLVVQKGTEWHIPILKLLKTPAAHTLLWEILQPFHFSAAQTAEVMKLAAHGENSSYIASATHRVIKNRNWLMITLLPAENAQHIVIEENQKHISFSHGALRIKTNPTSDIRHQTSEIAFLDASLIQFPLLLRPWKQGDYFYPLGMNKKKKISRFLIDQKLSATEKEKVWVLEMNHKIIWVVGMRIDNRFKLGPASVAALEIQVTPS